MAKHQSKPLSLDPVWDRIRSDAKASIAAEPLIGGMVHATILHHDTLESALAYRFAMKLASGEMSEQLLREIADEAYANDPSLGEAARADLTAVYERDPACHSVLQPLLFFKGFQAVQAYRIGHWLWAAKRRDLAYFIQARVSEILVQRAWELLCLLPLGGVGSNMGRREASCLGSELLVSGHVTG